jgi:TusA-related sulfurtransferase
MTPQATCDAGSLTMTDGLTILLARKLDDLSPGQVLEVRSSDSSFEHDVRAWARFTANTILEIRHQDSRTVCFIERGTSRRIITSSRADWGNQADIKKGQLDTRQLLIGAAARIPDHAAVTSGFSPRGAVAEDGGPSFPFDVVDANIGWSPESAAFYDQASAAHWNGTTDIPLFRGTSFDPPEKTRRWNAPSVRS